MSFCNEFCRNPKVFPLILLLEILKIRKYNKIHNKINTILSLHFITYISITTKLKIVKKLSRYFISRIIIGSKFIIIYYKLVIKI